MHTCKYFCTFAAELRKKMPEQSFWSKTWAVIKRYLLNKYILTLVVFGLIMFFVGDQSIRVRLRKAHQIRELETQRDIYQNAIDDAQKQLQTLSSRDSLEKFAREKYLMHQPNEDVFLVPENDR